MSESRLIDNRERGSLSETDLMPIRKDPASLFASDENIVNFHHFYTQGKEDEKIAMRVKITEKIRHIESQPDSFKMVSREAVLTGLRIALNLL